MPTTSFEMARWSYDIEGNALGYTTIAHSGGILPVYLLDGGPSLYVNVTGNEGHGNYDYGFSPVGGQGFQYYFPDSLYWRISRFTYTPSNNSYEVCQVCIMTMIRANTRVQRRASRVQFLPESLT